MKTGIIILAAGNSSRLGKPKQLLHYQGESLLEIVSKAAIQSSCNPIIIVLGAYAKEISAAHRLNGPTYVVNYNWEKGMSSSIAVGMSAALAHTKDLDQVIISVSDQPFISSEIIENLIKRQQESRKGIVSCSYAQTSGTPVLFRKKYFPQLLSLHGNQGAKQLLKQYPEDSSSLVFELGYIDIDTESDYNNLKLQR
ncbi:nucleotidyltransferase family protein [Pedobacter gandavensis]|uniref:NTP transferase domain-containing protein n=1 Tax=Pedobacter gandavensis TaxID=2679963 RepID=A0ABR6ES07_9SPHI|nr:nucleotidyltransferase family protein [Pedobacter gandavensis]MBB2148040.1 NTP transferase domain-containing protein [Pedobacter gandavensis]